MGITGKIFLFLNLVLAGVFSYFAVQDWKGRQTIEAAGLRHRILEVGLPLGDRPGDPTDMPTDPEAEVQFVIEGPGNKPTETVSVDLLKSYFSQASGAAAAEGQVALGGNQPVPSQLAEVKRVYNLLKGAVEKLDGGAQKATLVGPKLLLLAENYDERAEIQRLAAAGNGDELARRLYARFDQVVNPPRSPDVSAIQPGENNDPEALKERLKKAGEIRDGASKDLTERRARLAHLLVFLDPEAGWQKRVLMVIGAKAYARALAAQVIRVKLMTERVARSVHDEQERFISDYSQLKALAIQRTQLARDAEETQARLAAQAQKDDDFVRQRESHLAELKALLAKTKAEVDQYLASQALTEQQLFKLQREVADTLVDIYELEAELVRQERLRYAGKN